MRKYSYLIFLIIPLIISCGGFGFRYQKKISDDIYLTAIDEMEQMSLSYKTSKNGYNNLIDQTIYEIQYDSNYIIVKQHPRKYPNPINKDSTNFYLINLKTIRAKKAKFVSKIDTIKFRSVYKDKNGEDSLGKTKTDIYKTKYLPESPTKLTQKEFNKLKTELNIGDTLKNIITFKKLK